MKQSNLGATKGATFPSQPAGAPQVDPPLLNAAMQALQDETTGIARLLTHGYFTFELEGKDLLLTEELRAAVETKLGEPLVEIVLPNLAGQVNLLPASRANALRTASERGQGAQPC